MRRTVAYENQKLKKIVQLQKVVLMCFSNETIRKVSFVRMKTPSSEYSTIFNWWNVTMKVGERRSPWKRDYGEGPWKRGLMEKVHGRGLIEKVQGRGLMEKVHEGSP